MVMTYVSLWGRPYSQSCLLLLSVLEPTECHVGQTGLVTSSIPPRRSWPSHHGQLVNTTRPSLSCQYQLPSPADVTPVPQIWFQTNTMGAEDSPCELINGATASLDALRMAAHSGSIRLDKESLATLKHAYNRAISAIEQSMKDNELEAAMGGVSISENQSTMVNSRHRYEDDIEDGAKDILEDCGLDFEERESSHTRQLITLMTTDEEGEQQPRENSVWACLSTHTAQISVSDDHPLRNEATCHTQAGGPTAVTCSTESVGWYKCPAQINFLCGKTLRVLHPDLEVLIPAFAKSRP